jgi:hypothetical protein
MTTLSRYGSFLIPMTLAVALGGNLLAQTSATTYVLPDIPLSTFLEENLFGVQVNDRGIKLGGIGSDLWRDRQSAGNVYWMITDRGPNGQIPVAGANRRTFPIAEFTPFILKVKVTKKGIKILESIPITGLSSVEQGVSGLSNTTRDEVPFDCAAQTQLTYNAHGLDTEGIVRTKDGTFWVVDEYSPSILKIDAQGKVVKRFLPQNLTPQTNTPGYLSVNTLPEILGKRKGNRGFEGIALSMDEKTIFAVVQSPLLNPDTATGNASRNTRIYAFDIATERVTAEYVYRFQPIAEFNHTDPTEMKVSALAMVDEKYMLVLERTDLIAKIYRVDISGATNILGTRWDAAATTPTLESLNDAALTQNSVNVLPKELILVLDSAKGYPQKIEGLAIINKRTIAIANDNDFGVGQFNISGTSCTLIDTGNRSTIMEIRLDKPLVE